MGKRTRSLRVRPVVLMVLLISCFLQNVAADGVSKTIIGLDLGMSSENLDSGRRVVTSVLTQADDDEQFGLVIADELVRTAIDPLPAKELLATFSSLPFAPSDTGNFSVLLERSLAMDAASATDNTRLWVISNGEIKLTASDNKTEKQKRYKMWASNILLPDIASRYSGFRMITPGQNNQEMVDVVIGVFGEQGHQMLPGTEDDVAQFVDSLVSGALTNTMTGAKVADSSNDESNATTDVEIIHQTPEGESIVTDNDTTPVQTNISGKTNENSADLVVALNDDLLLETEQTVTAMTDISSDTEDEPLVPAANKLATQAASSDTANFNVSSINNQINTGIVEEQATDSSSTTIDVEVTSPNVEDSGVKIRSVVTLAILTAISILALILVTLFRKRSYSSEASKDDAIQNSPATGSSATAESVTLLNRPSASDSVMHQPIANKEGVPENNDIQPETILVAQPPITPDRATAVTQVSSTDETVVNPYDHSQENISLPDSVEANSVADEFSAFDRSIIEKRSVKNKKVAPSGEK